MNRFHIGPLHFDSSSRILYKGSLSIVLPAKAADVLLVLLKNAGLIVSRETIRQAVWGTTHTEEDNLSKNISLLRNTFRAHISDSEQILTLSKRGYQFVGHVDVEVIVDTNEPVSTSISSNSSFKSPPNADFTSEPLDMTALSTPSSVSRIWFWSRRQFGLFGLFGVSARIWSTIGGRTCLLGGILVVELVGVSLGLWYRQTKDSSTDPTPTIAILSLKSLSSETSQDWLAPVLKYTVGSRLIQGNSFHLISDERATQIEQDMGLYSMRVIDDITVQTVGRHLGCNLVFVGSYLPEGDNIRIDFQLRSTKTGQVVSEFSRVTTLEGLLQSTTDADSSFRIDLARPSGARNDVDANDRWNKLDLYQSGIEMIRQGKPLEARQYLYHAVLSAPHSTLIHSALARDWSLLGYHSLAASEARLVLSSASTLQNDERLAAEANAYAILSDWPRARQLYEILLRGHADNVDYALGLANALTPSGHAGQAMDSLRSLVSSSANAASNPYVSESQAEAAGNLSDWREQLLYAGKMLAQSRTIGSTFLEVRAHLLESSAWSYLGNQSAAASSTHQVAEISYRIGYDSGIADALINEGNEKLADNDPSCIATYRQALVIQKRLGDPFEVGVILNNMAVEFAWREDWIAARDGFQQSLDLALKEHTSVGKLYQRSSIAFADAALGHFDESYAEAKRALVADEAVGAMDQTIESRTLIGDLEVKRGNLAAARVQYGEAKKTGEINGDFSQSAREERNLALVEMSAGNLVEARHLLEHAISLNVLKGEQLVDIQHTAAALDIEEGNPERAIDAMTKLVKTSKTVHISAEAWRVIAEAWLARKNTAEARVAINNALDLSRKSPNTHSYLIPASITAARIDAATGDSTKALVSLSVMLREVEKVQDIPLELNIRLVQGEIELSQVRKVDSIRRGLQTLTSTRTIATKYGFGLVRDKADNLLRLKVYLPNNARTSSDPNHQVP